MKRTLLPGFLLALALLLAAAPAHALQQSSPEAWTAPWISAPGASARDGAEADGSRRMPLFRRRFLVHAGLRDARLRVAGLGQWRATLDGDPIGSTGMQGDWTDYRKRVNYRTYGLTLKPGFHALGVALGNGMYNVQRTVYTAAEQTRPIHLAPGKARYTKFEGSYGVPVLTAELRLRYADGTVETILTDADWRTAPGGVTFSSTYGGEDYDAALEPLGWQRPGFADDRWKAAVPVAGPGGVLSPALAPELEETGKGAPARVTALSGTKTIYDFGLNRAAVPSLTVHGPRGAVLRLTPGELLNADGTVSQRSSGGPVWWSYTLSGAAREEHWSPQFGYYGFRYLQAEWMTGVSGKVDQLAVLAVHSLSRETGSFQTSNETLNRIHAMIVAAMDNNQVSVFTDCPHREKLGWLEETHLVADAMLFNNDLAGLYRATSANIADAQAADGMVPTIAPQYTKFGPKYPVYDDSPEWGSAAVLAPWAAYRFYGDEAELARDYPVMQRYLFHLQSRAEDGLVAYGLGDWYDVGPGPSGFEKNTTLGVTGTLMLYQDAATLGRIAKILHHAEDAASYDALAARTATAFERRFWNAALGWYDTGSQTANAMPLALGIVPEAHRAQVLAHLIADVHAHDDHLTTGEVGFPYLLRALSAAGENELVLKLLLRPDPPSYAAQLAAGATALTEAWDANPANSQDHLMLGAGEEWFYRALGGIDFDLSRAGSPLVLHPAALPSLEFVTCRFDSIRGTILTRTEHGHGGTFYEVTLPIAAHVVLPGNAEDMDTHAHLPAAFTAAPGHHRYRLGPS